MALLVGSFSPGSPQDDGALITTTVAQAWRWRLYCSSACIVAAAAWWLVTESAGWLGWLESNTERCHGLLA